jgi:hypothetical protein
LAFACDLAADEAVDRAFADAARRETALFRSLGLDSRVGVFANRSRWRKLLPAPPPSRYAGEAGDGAAALSSGEPADSAPTETAAGSATAGGTAEQPVIASRPRSSWAQLLRRVLSVDALACPRCSTREQSVPMVVLAFLSDPDVVSRILRHLGLPVSAPALAPARASGRRRGFELGEEVGRGGEDDHDEDDGTGKGRAPPS